LIEAGDGDSSDGSESEPSEDNLNIEMFSNMEKTAEKYSNVSEFEKTVCDLFSDHQVKRAEIFENQLKKLQNN
jgi:hypothetical protein